MRHLIAILLILLIFGLPVPAMAQESVDGVINGQVINGTEGGGSVAEIEVTLIAYADDMIAETRSTETDQEGKFQFVNVDIEYTYLVTAKYMEVDYYYPVVFEPGDITASVEVGVCDATTSSEAIWVGLAHTIINVEEEGLLVTEFFWLVNDSDKTYVGTDWVLVFTLPEGATGFEAPQELLPDYQLLDNNRVTYLVPFPPGERQLTFSYGLVKPDTAEFTIPMVVDYPTESLELMVGGEDIEVSVDQLAPAEPVITSTGERFIHFWGENLPGGTVINLRLYNPSAGGGLSPVVLGVIIAVVIIGIAVYMVRKRRKGDENE
jgi:hypothetical protein